MRVLMIADFYHPAIGGVEQHVRSLSHALVARNHDVAVATLRLAGTEAREEDGGVRVHRVRGSAQRVERLFRNPHRPWAPPLPDPELAWSLGRVLAAEQPDVVHGHDWLARSFLPLRRRSNAAFVLSLHYYTLSCAKKDLVQAGRVCMGPAVRKCVACSAAHYGPAKGPAVAAANWAGAAAERARADRVIAVSRATALGNGLLPGSPDCEIVPNFVPEEEAVPVSAIAPYLAQLPTNDFLLFVGDLRPAKGIDILLAAYDGLVDPPPLVLIGKTWPESPRSLPEGVRLLRDWPNPAVRAAWARCLFGIVPSVWSEPFGIVVIEAMAAGRPVVASSVGGIPEIVLAGQTGLLVPPGDPIALRAAMARLLAEPSLRTRLGQAARLRAAAYRADQVVPRIEQVYREAIAIRSRAPLADPFRAG